jgi:VanZ family protein
VWGAAFAGQLALIAFASYLAYAGLIPASLLWVTRQFDWAFHALLFGPLGMLLDRALRERAVFRVVPLGPAIVLVAAGVEELLQQLSPRRSTTLHDYVADVVGVVAFTWLARVVLRDRDTGS